MELIKFGIDFVLHLDKYLDLAIRAIGAWTYLLLFGVIFIETGLVIMPFLPGDSLLFAAGAFASRDSLSVFSLWPLLALAAVVGDTVNYWIGHQLGARMVGKNSRLIKREYLERTQAFYEKHGGKTILLARFVPIVRTFAPFVAGIGKMRYSYFFSYNVIGGILWTSLFIWGGYFFGGLPIVEKNFSIIVIAIILISVAPALIEVLKNRHAKKTSRASLPSA